MACWLLKEESCFGKFKPFFVSSNERSKGWFKFGSRDKSKKLDLTVRRKSLSQQQLLQFRQNFGGMSCEY